MGHRHLRMVWLLFALIIVLCILVPMVYAGGRYVAKGEDVEIVLHDEDCALGAVNNLPLRATWKERDGKVIDGCWSVKDGLVIFYFSDRTVVVLPAKNFARIGSI